MVCLSILAIEVVILVPSYLSRKAELYGQLEAEGMREITAALRNYDHHNLSRILADLSENNPNPELRGGSIYDDAGELLATFGEQPVLRLRSNDPAPPEPRRLVSEDRLEVLWPAEFDSTTLTLVARMDAESINSGLLDFVGRVGGLVLIISVFVSAATVAANGLLVLNPLLEIRRKLRAAEDDPTNADRYKLDIVRDDEIGETAAAINALLTRLADVRRSDVQEREQRLKDFGDASSDWFWEMDEQLRFSYFSDRFGEITGVSQDALLGKTRQETGIPGVEIEVWRQHLADLAACRPFRDFVHPRVRSDGQTVYLSINGKPIFDEHGTFKGFRGTGRDVTERKLREEALVVAKRQAEVANRAKTEFLANMSHELRTPLNAVIGFAEIMKEGRMGPIGNPRYLEYVSDIHESGRHLLHLINDVLDLSKIEAGTAKLKEDNLDVEKTIDTCLRLIAQRAEAGQLDITREFPGQPMSPLFADPQALKQILVHLLSNAVKFTPAGGRVNILAQSSPEDGHIIQISDTGIGIEPENIPRALARFQQVEGQLDRTYEGSGLGLSLAKSLTELHGGALELRSQVGVGTTVTIRFPAERVVTTDQTAGPDGEMKIAMNERR